MPTETAPDWFMRTGTCHRSLLIVVAALLLTACVHRVTLHGRDGERLEGKWRHAQQGNGVIQVLAPDGERLGGTLTAVPRRSFLQQYAAVFGANSIDAEGPDLSAYGHGLWVLPGNSNALAEAVHGESFAAATVPNARMVRGPAIFLDHDAARRERARHSVLPNRVVTQRPWSWPVQGTCRKRIHRRILRFCSVPTSTLTCRFSQVL
jgi:hypothetical protein